MSGNVLALVSTIVSACGLIAVTIALLLQSKQLRLTQLQSARTAQIEIIRIAIERPDVYVDPTDTSDDGASYPGRLS